MTPGDLHDVAPPRRVAAHRGFHLVRGEELTGRVGWLRLGWQRHPGHDVPDGGAHQLLASEHPCCWSVQHVWSTVG